MDDLKKTVEAVIMRIFEGDSLKKALEYFKLSRYLFGKALNLDSELSSLYARAQQMQAEADVDEIKEIADTDLDPQRARNRIDVRKWRASKLDSKKYGEKLDLNVNEQIDLTVAIESGLKRAIPTSYRKNEDVPQLTEAIALNANTHTGSEPVVLSAAEKKRRQDILS